MKKDLKSREKAVERKAELGYVGLEEKISNNKKWFIFSIIAAVLITGAVVAVLIVTNAI